MIDFITHTPTPGPWRVACDAIVSIRGDVVATVVLPDREMTHTDRARFAADAALLAAAPELALMLRILSNAVRDFAVAGPDWPERKDAVALLERIDAAGKIGIYPEKGG